MMFGRGLAYGYGGYGCGGWLPMLLFVIVIFGFIILLIVKRPRRNKEHQGSQALAILNERLAKGEITTEEYERLKKIIQH
jgi:putative membrane protein